MIFHHHNHCSGHSVLVFFCLRFAPNILGLLHAHQWWNILYTVHLSALCMSHMLLSRPIIKCNYFIPPLSFWHLTRDNMQQINTRNINYVRTRRNGVYNIEQNTRIKRATSRRKQDVRIKTYHAGSQNDTMCAVWNKMKSRMCSMQKIVSSGCKVVWVPLLSKWE